MTKPWNAARAASQRPLRKPYKACGPVGDPANNASVPWSVQRLREGFGNPFEGSGLNSVARGDGIADDLPALRAANAPKAIVGMDLGVGDSTTIIRGEWKAGKLTITESEVLPPNPEAPRLQPYGFSGEQRELAERLCRTGSTEPPKAEPGPPVGARLAKAVESIRADALRTGQELTGEVRLMVYAYQRIGRGGASLSAAGDIVLMCHPHDEVEVWQALGMEGP